MGSMELVCNDAKCQDLIEAWSAERDRWTRACESLQMQCRRAKREVNASEFQACCLGATEEQCKAEVNAMRAELRAEMHTEVAECDGMKTQLQNCLTCVNKLQRKLDEHCTPLQQHTGEYEEMSSCSTEPLHVVGVQRVPTPQLNEFEGYKTLVERLRAELQWERAERETSDNNLASLRSSYQMLLERVDAPAAAHGSTANAKRCV